MKTSIIVKRLTAIAMPIILVLLSGCMYSGEVKQQGSLASSEYISVVQNAIDTYHKATGVLPIKNKPMETPVYEKYLIDFKKLTERHMLTTVPTNAFENGGAAIYVLVDPETKPTVKLMDLAAYQKIEKLQTDVNAYMDKTGKRPFGVELAPSFYALDFDKLGEKLTQVQSPFSRQYLTVMIHESGLLAIDYGPDMMKLVTSKGITPDAKLDLRSLLVTEGFYVPARSFPYHWIGNQPVPSLE